MLRLDIETEVRPPEPQLVVGVDSTKVFTPHDNHVRASDLNLMPPLLSLHSMFLGAEVSTDVGDQG